MKMQVRSIWIEGVLEQSLHNSVVISMGLREQQEAIANPRLMALQETQSARMLPPGTHITQVYDNSEGELLILGDPGSGKTILLLELTRALLDRAGQDETHLLPVVFNLSSWATKWQSLADWLVEELNVRYQVSRQLAQGWVDANQVLPLLDGLDEVPSLYIGPCIKAINTYHKDHPGPLVVCCRSDVYQDQPERLQLHRAVAIQPLTNQQIEEYLGTNEELIGVRDAFRADPALRELATNPLMLSILAQAYSGDAAEKLLTTNTPGTLRQQIFATYVQRMLTRRGISNYTEQQTIHWLSWLARQLIKHRQTVFFVEQMQPDWLPDKRAHRIYELCIGVVTGLLAGLWLGWFFCLLTGWFGGTLLGVVFGVVFMLTSRVVKEIRTIDVVWSRKTVQKVLFFGVSSGLASGLFFGFIASLVLGQVAGVLLGLVFGLINGLIFGLAFGVSPVMRDRHDQVIAGMVHSTQRDLLNGLLFWQVSGLLLGLIGALLGGPVFGLLYMLALGLILVLLCGFVFSGMVPIQRLSLHLLLWREKYCPWNYVRFLDYAAECVLLRKVGNGYIFVHRLLLEYFATLDRTPAVNDAETR